MFIKLVLGNQIHLLNKQMTIVELHSFIADRFKNIHQSYDLIYIDSDGDTISIISDNDLKSLEQISNGKAIKVFINKIQSSQKTGASQQVRETEKIPVTFQDVKEQIKNNSIQPQIVREAVTQISVQDSQTEILQQLKQQNQTQEQNKKENINENTHIGFSCDGCKVFPIVGIRYNCTSCSNFDFCQKCQNTISHEHDFVKIKNPKPCEKTNQFKVFQKLGKPVNSIQQQKFEKKCKKIQNFIKKPIEAFAHILKAHPMAKSFKKMNFNSVFKRKQPENKNDIVQPPQENEQPVMKLFTNPIIVKTQVQQPDIQQKVVDSQKSEQQLVLEAVEQIIGSSPEIRQFVEKNYQQGIEQIIQKWFDQE